MSKTYICIRLSHTYIDGPVDAYMYVRLSYVLLDLGERMTG